MAMLSESLIQFSIDGWSFVPFLLFTWAQTMVEVMKIMATSFKRSHACTAALSAPTLQQATTNPRLCWRPVDAHGQVWISLLWVTAPFSWVLVHTGFVCPLQEPVSPVLYKFWQLYGGVNGDLLQEGLCHTQDCCTDRLQQATADLSLHRRHSNTQRQV